MESGTRTFYLGRYNCIEQLGTGPLGETFRAKIYGVAGFEKQFAVKRLHPHLGADEAFVARFVQAASAFAALDHPRIVRVHEVNAQGASYYIVVDLVRGLDLRRLLDLLQQRGEALPADAAMTIACDVAEALEHAHGRTNALPNGVLHLGLTPSSVMLTYEGEAKLIDVGLMAALVRPGWSDEDALAPTLAYVSPEELRGDPVDARADVFSLGVVLHELLGGARVFFSDRAAELRQAIESGPPAPPPADPRLQQVVTRALQPDREQRFASMAELRVAVQSILGGRAERARSDLSALVRRLALPRERRTGAFAAVSLPTGGTTPLAAGATAAATATATATAGTSVKPPPMPTPRPWAPPTPRPPIGPQLSPVPQANTLAGIGPDDQALVPIELIELPGSPTEKAMPVAEDAETNRVTRAEASEVAERPASTPPPLPADVAVTSEANGAKAEAKGTNGTHAATPEATWTPPAVVPPPPSPAPAFAKPAVEVPAPVEPARQAVPGARLPPRAGANRAVLGTVVLLAGAGVLAVYFGLSDYFNAENTLATKPAATEKAPPEKPTADRPAASGVTTAAASGAAAAPASGAVVAPVSGAVVAPASGAAVARASGAPVAPASGATVAAAGRAAVAPTTAAPASAAPATAAGTFAVVTTPPGATVFVDGEPGGTTPAQLDVAPGRHHLVVAGEHSRLVKRDVDVQAGGKLELTLEPAKLPTEVAGPAGLKVRCHTKGELRIFVDGADAGLSCPNDERIDVTPGTHKIGLFSPRTGEMHEVEHEVTEGDHSTRVYVKY